MGSLTLLSWNINFRAADSLVPFAGLQAQPDLVLLQEVTNGHLESICDALRSYGYAVVDSCEPHASDKRYGTLVAIRAPLSPQRIEATGFPWRQLVLHVRVGTGGRSIDVVNVHIPNGSGNGWRKVEALEALRGLVANRGQGSMVVAGDFNEPRYEPLQDGRVVTWGQDLVDDRWVPWDRWTFDGVTDSGSRWDAAARWIFEDSGLREAYWVARPGSIGEPSHLVRGAGRWFDHVFVTPDLQVESCDYLHDWRTTGFSDHSPVAVKLSYAPD